MSSTVCNIWMTRRPIPSSLREDQDCVAQMLALPTLTRSISGFTHMQFVAEQFDAIFKDKTDQEQQQIDTSILNSEDVCDGITQHLIHYNLSESKASHNASQPLAITESAITQRGGPREDDHRLINNAISAINKQTEAQRSKLYVFWIFLEQIVRRYGLPFTSSVSSCIRTRDTHDGGQ